MIFLDTTALVCLLEKPKAGESVTISNGRTRMLQLQDKLKKTRESGGAFYVPSSVLSEYLLGFPQCDAEQQYADLMGRTFYIVPYDVRSARETVRIVHALGGMVVIKQMTKDIGYTRQVAKVDLQVLALAKQHKARMLISGDAQLQKFANKLNVECHLAWEIPEKELFVPATPIAAKEQGQSLFD